MSKLTLNLREKMNAAKLTAAALAVSSMSALCGISAFAEETDSSIEDVMESSFSSVGDSLVAMVGTILPIALGILSVVLVVTFGIKIFKKIIGKGT